MAYPNNYNTCMFCGRLVKEPEIKHYDSSNGGFNKALFTLAVDRKMSAAQKQEAQSKGEPTADFVDFSTSLANHIDTLQKYCAKGKPIMVQAAYRKYTYKDQSGQTKYGHVFEVVELAFVPRDSTGNNENNNGNSGGNNNSYQNNQPQQPPMNPPQQAANNGFNMFDDANEPF